jgi:uncharacterized protein YabE (DUF348 family)
MPAMRPASLARFGLVVAVAAALLLAIYFNTRIPVIIQADGETRQVLTHAATVEAALREAGLTLYPEDAVQPSSQTALTPHLTISVTRAPVIEIDVDGQTRLVRTPLTFTPAILASQNIHLDPQDQVWADGVPIQPGQLPPKLTAPHRLVVVRAVTLLVSDGAQAEVPVRAAGRTVGEALWAASYRLFGADEVTPPLDTPATANLKVSINRSRPVTVLADGRALSTRTHSVTAGAVLGEVGVALAGQDYIVPAADQPFTDTVRVVRVRETALTDYQVIPFDSAYQATADWEIDTVGQVQAGAAGVKQRRTRIRYEDGVEVTRTVESEIVAVKPTSRIIGYGTKIVIRTLDTPDGTIEYWRAYMMYATSYAAKFMGGSNRTRAGMHLTKGVVAIDLRYIPFFTRMYVPGYGPAVAGDTGGGVKGRWIDLGFDDFNYEGWHQKVMVYFLTPVPPLDQITWIIPSTVP